MHTCNTVTTKKGFTLVETLVAITVLLLVIIGPMTVAQKSIQNSYYANEQVTAVFLAQEAIEALRELRDRDALDAYDEGLGAETWSWYSVIHANCKTNEGCAYNNDPDDGGFESCSANNDCVLKYEESADRYSYTPGNEDSQFTRKVYLEETENGGVHVTVDVLWNARVFGNQEKTVRLQTWLYDQYERFES